MIEPPRDRRSRKPGARLDSEKASSLRRGTGGLPEIRRRRVGMVFDRWSNAVDPSFPRQSNGPTIATPICLSVDKGRFQMIRQVSVGIIALALSIGTAAAQAKIEKVPIKPVTASDGKQMFSSYCAVCHGAEAKGNGPAAASLTKTPADLTRISARNGGTFPAVKVQRYIQGLDEIPAHGTRDMPMWGDLFRSLNPDAAQIRVAALTEYLKSLQQ
jgi:mono/diheme cytochrome c family protein